MKQDLAFLNSFHCPICSHEGLEGSKKSVKCPNCNTEFPVTNGVPWLLPNAGEDLKDWQNRYHLFVDLNKTEAGTLKYQAQKDDLLDETKDRLKRMVQAKIEHGREVSKVLEALEIDFDNGPKAGNLSAGTELPDTQSLMSYYVNIFRDWSYGDEENQKCIEEIAQVVPSEAKWGTLGVIGSGACRLAYDLHRKFAVETTINTDINPFLMFVGQRMANGKSLNLFEFPIAPKNLESFAVKLKCKAPDPLKDNFYFALADGMNPIFKKDSLDTLLTPWLIDIVHQDLKDQFRRYNNVLRKGGRWVNFGSLSFFHRDQTICYSVEETLRIIESSGFKIENFRHEEIPYLHSPYSCQKRFERVLTFSAIKVQDVEQPEASFEFLPDWLENGINLFPLPM